MSPPEPRPAAGAIVFTRSGLVLIGRRREDLNFLGGFAVFPGGRVDPADAASAVRMFGERPDGVAKAAALRELYEEAGLVLDGRKLKSVPEAPPAQSFDAVLASLDAHPDASPDANPTACPGARPNARSRPA